MRPAPAAGRLSRPSGLRPGLTRALAAAAGAGRRLAPLVSALPRPGPRGRRGLVVALVALLALGAIYRFWLRDSPLVSVDRVTVTGLTTKDAKRLRASLVSTARSMTTLHVERERLEKVVAGYPVVRSIEVHPDFPHTLHIRVVEHEPAAMAVSRGGRVPVASDGTVLEGLPVEGSLPVVRTDGALRGDRLADLEARGAVRVAGAAPAALRRRLLEVDREDDKGYVAQLRKGPELVFGDAKRLRAKWIAAARVLADAESQGASYVDLRVPGRPAVGGLNFQTTAPAVSALPSAPPASTGDTTGAVGPQGAAAPAGDPAAIGEATTGQSPAATTPPAADAPATSAPVTPQTPAAPTAGAGGGAAAAPSP